MTTWARAVPLVGYLLVANACAALFGVEEASLRDGAAPAGAAGAGGEDGGGAANDPGIGGQSGGTGGVPSNAGEGGGPSGGATADSGAGGDSGAGPSTPNDGGAGAAPAGGTGGAPVNEAGAGGTVEPVAGAGGASSCTNGEVRCESTTHELECDDGVWKSLACDIACIGDACAECSPTETECDVLRTSVRTCGDDGHFGPPVPCGERTCFEGKCDGVCAWKTKRCNVDTGDVDVCGETGNWQVDEPCASQVEICVEDDGAAECVENVPRPLGPSLPYPTLRAMGPNVLRVFPVGEADATAYVLTLELIGGGDPQSTARLALYEDDGSNRPGALVAATANITVTGANGRAPIDPDALVTAGTSYWVGVVFADGGSPQLRGNTNPDAAAGYETPLPFAESFPDPFPSGTPELYGTEFNLFVMVRTRTP